MFTKLSLLALAAPLMVSALKLAIPENPTSSGTITIKWTNEPNDPVTWSFELTNVAFNQAFAIANNVNPSASSLILTLPVVPVGDGYTLQAVNIGNITDVFAETPDFAIGAATTTLPFTPTVTPSASVTRSGNASSTNAGTTSATPSVTVSNTLGFSSNIVTPSATSPVTTGSAGTASASTSGSTTSASTFSAASRLSIGGSAGGFAAVLFSAIAGAMIAL